MQFRSKGEPTWHSQFGYFSVDLQTKTATFQSGLAEAARAARGSFSDISEGAGEMGKGVAKGSIDIRHSLGLVDNVIRGAHAQAMADLVRMYAESALVMNTLPIAAAAAGLALIGGIAYEAYEHVKKLKDAEAALNDDLMKMGTAGNNAFRQLDDAILKAQEQADELRNNHVDALRIQLALIDHQSMSQLVKSFEMVQKAADVVFKTLAGHWYTLGSGSDGASHALGDFKTKYENLLSLGKDKEASDLLHGTLGSAKEVLQLQQTILSSQGSTGMMGRNFTDADAYYSSQMRLRQLGVGYSKSEVESQQQLVKTLEQQVGIESRVNELKKIDSGNATTGAGHAAAARRSSAAKEAAEAQASMAQSAIAGDKAAADAQLTIHRASLEERLKSDLDFASREYQTKEAANKVEIAALNKSGNDYANQLKALNGKALEIQQQYATQKAEMKAHAAVAINQRDVQALEQGIREQIDATRQGSSARLSAIDAGLREEQAHQLQDTQFYRELSGQRVQVMRQMGEEQRKQQADAGREAADNDQKMQELSLTGLRQHFALYDSGHHVSRNTQMQQATAVANQEYQIKTQALQKQAEALDKSGSDYANKLKAIQNKETQLVRQHENEIAAIKGKAAQDQAHSVLDAQTKMHEQMARDLTQSSMRHQTWAHTLSSLSNQVISSMMETAMKSIMADDMTKERDAASAARSAFKAGMQLPFPANLVAAPALAAGAFASVMAFEGGGVVPGVGRGDIVPAMLTPGEGVVPGGVMDGLKNMARNGGFDQGGHTTVIHVRPTYHVNAIDGDGMNKALTKHSAELQTHVAKAIRQTNHGR